MEVGRGLGGEEVQVGLVGREKGITRGRGMMGMRMGRRGVDRLGRC